MQKLIVYEIEQEGFYGYSLRSPKAVLMREQFWNTDHECTKTEIAKVLGASPRQLTVVRSKEKNK